MSTLSERIVHNTLSSTAGYAVALVASLLLAPYMLAVLGAEQFGVWVILAVATTYFSLLDLGVSASFIKHLTDALTKRQPRRRDEIVSTGWLFYLGFSLAVVAVGLAAEGPLLRLLSVGPDAAPVYWGVLAIFAVRSSFLVFRSLLFSLQRLDVLNAIEILSTLINAAGTVAALAAGYGLRGVVAAALVSAVFHVGAEVAMGFRLCPDLSPRLSRASLRTFRPLFRYGAQLQASRCAELVHLHVDKLLLSHFVGLTHVAMYELGAKVAGLSRSLPTVLLPAILPAASQLEAQRNRADLLRLYERGSKYLVGAALPLAVFTALSAPTIIDAWLGAGDYGNAVLAVRLLAAAYLFHLLTGMGLAVARGIGVVHYEMRALMVSALLNVVLSLLLVTRAGLFGVLIATTCSTIVGYGLFMGSLHRYLKLPLAVFARKVYALPAAGAAAAVVALLALGHPIALLEGGAQLESVRLAALVDLAVTGALFFAVYGAIIFKSRYIALGDLGLVRKALASWS